MDDGDILLIDFYMQPARRFTREEMIVTIISTNQF
jgi:hypothetical protein